MLEIKRCPTCGKIYTGLAIVGLATGLIVAFGGSEETAQTVSGCIMSTASVIAYIVGEGLSDAAGAAVTKENNNNKED